MKRYVIIGGGVASVACAEGIRAVDKDGSITIIADEKRETYCRPLISYYLQGKTDLEKMKYRTDAFYTENRLEWVYGSAVSIDSAKKVVSLEGGRSIPYDALCIATGSTPFVPPMNGLDEVECKYGFMTLDDALALEKTLSAAPRVLIVGAGLIGLKCAEGLSGRAKSITVCDLAPRVLSSILDEPCAALIQRRLEENGVELLLSDSVDSFEKNTAHMKSGRTVPFDALVLAVGVRPNTALAKSAGCDIGRGIIVDDSMRTSVEGIFAAGDCAQGTDISGESRVIAILPSAYMQGRCAGSNMAGGGETVSGAIPMNAIGFFGLHALTAGDYVGNMYEISDEGSIKRLFVKDGLLRGFILIGEIKSAGIYTALIRNKTPLDSVDFEGIMKSPSLASFSGQYRAKTLGGVV